MTTRLLPHPTSLGDVTLRGHYGEHGDIESVEVLHADPQVLICAELIRGLCRGVEHPRVPLASVDRAEVGGVFRVCGSNRTLIYVLTCYEPMLNGHRVPDMFIGEWPD